MTEELLDTGLAASDQEFDFDDRITEVLTNGYEISVGAVVSDAWTAFKKGAGSMIGFLLLYIVGAMVTSLVVPEYYIGKFWVDQVLGPAISVLFVGSLLFGRRAHKGLNMDFSHFFDGFKKFGALYVGYLLPQVMMVLVAIMAFVIAAGTSISSIGQLMDPQYLVQSIFQMELSMGLAAIVVVLAAIYISVSYTLAPMIIWFGNQSPWQAMELSRKIVGKKFFHFFWLYVVLFLIQLLGIICLLVGLLATIPLLFVALYMVYEHIIGTPATEVLEIQE